MSQLIRDSGELKEITFVNCNGINYYNINFLMSRNCASNVVYVALALQ